MGVFKNAVVSAIALSLTAVPAVASADAAKLSLAKSARVAAPQAKKEKLSGGGVIVAILAAAAVIAGIVIVADNDDKPNSP